MADNKENRKLLVREYKERKRQIGVFGIRNKVTNRVFIDKTLNLDVAYNRHRFTLNMGSHRNKELQADWNQYGEENFSYEIIETIEDNNDDQKATNDDLVELEELCRERIFETSGINSIY